MTSPRPIERRTVRALGLLGLLPWFGLALVGSVLPAGSTARQMSYLLLVGLAALSLAFAGAVHWGVALAGTGHALHARQALQWGAAAAALGFLALALAVFGAPPAAVLIVLAVDLGLCRLADGALLRQSAAVPAWYLPMRSRWTGGAIVALALAIPAYA